ncbi:hypothetical protein D3C74_91730 [compost metagenome]
MEQLAFTLQYLSETENDESKTYSSFLIYDYLERIKDQTAWVTYDDGFLSFRLPVMIGDMQFSTIGSTSNQIRLVMLKNVLSKINFHHTLTSLQVEGRHIKALFSENVWEIGNRKKSSSGPRIIENKPGIAQLQLTDLELHRWSTKKQKNTQHSLNNVLGKMVQLQVRTYNDWIYHVESLPFIVEECMLKYKTITLKGSQGAEIHCAGVVGVREQEGYTIIDIRDPLGRMNRSFDIWYKKPTFF